MSDYCVIPTTKLSLLCQKLEEILASTDNELDEKQKEINIKISKEQYDALLKEINYLNAEIARCRISKQAAICRQPSNLTIPIIPIQTYLMKKKVDKKYATDFKNCVYIAGVLDYVCSDIVEVSGNRAKYLNSDTINPIHINFGIMNINDAELSALLNYINFIIPDINDNVNMCDRIKMITHNINNYFKSNNLIKFESKINDKKFVENNKNCICNVLDESSLFLLIFENLSYCELQNDVSKTCRLFYQKSLIVMQNKYSRYIYCDSLNEGIERWPSMLHPDLELREDSVILINGLLIAILNCIVDNMIQTRCYSLHNDNDP